MINEWDSQVNDICRTASASGTITRTSINILARMFRLLSAGAQLAVEAIDASIINGATKIIEDGSGVFDKDRIRIGD